MRVRDGKGIETVWRRSAQVRRSRARNRNLPVLSANALGVAGKVVFSLAGIRHLICEARHPLKDGGRERERVDAVVGDAEVATDRGLASLVWVPCKSNRRTDVVPVVVVELARDKREVGSRIVSIGQINARDEPRSGLETRGHSGVETDTVIDDEIGQELPRILNVEVVLRPAVVHDVNAASRLERGASRIGDVTDRHIADSSQQVVGSCIQIWKIILSVDCAAAGRGRVVVAGVNGISSSAETDLRNGVERTDRAAVVDLASVAQINTGFESVGVLYPGEVV